MALKRVARSVTVSRRDGRFVAESPAGWSVWSSDGRVVPPPGTYRVSHTGMTVRKRSAGGTFTPVEGDLVTIESGEAITADYRNDGDVLMVELIPPPCFVGFVWGGCRGLKQDSAPGDNHQRQRVAGPQGRQGGGIAYQRFGCGRVGIATRRVHACDADVYSGVGSVRHKLVYAPRCGDLHRDSYPAGLHGPGVRHHHLPHDVAQGVSA